MYLEGGRGLADILSMIISIGAEETTKSFSTLDDSAETRMAHLPNWSL
jgi:hypothetical protein